MIANLYDLLGPSIAWCIVQVSIVAVIGILCSWIVSRRDTVAACTVICATVLVSGLLTIVAPLPVHHSVRLAIQSRANFLGNAPSVSGNRSVETTQLHETASPSSNVSWIDLQSAGLFIQGIVKNAHQIELQHRTRFHWASLFLIVVAAMGLIRFLVGAAFILRIAYRSKPITNGMVRSTSWELANQLGCRSPVDIREHPDFTDAAVAGWFRPILILPRHWQQWDNDELRSVIAHELAHIVRCDSIWRLTTSSLTSMHLFNPFVYWLLQRLALYQELAADALAASVVGPRVYLRSLSSLAIRHDVILGRNVSPDMLPVFSGHLIRRIKMLLSTNGKMNSNHGRNHRSKTIAISTVFIAIGVAALATRGIAEPPTTPKPAIAEPIKNVSFTKQNSASAKNPAVDPTNVMFQRTPLDPEIFGNNSETGMVVIRVNELLNRKEMKLYGLLLNSVLAPVVTADLQSPTVPLISVEEIEWIAGIPNITLKPKTKDEKGLLMFGAGNFTVKFKNPINLKNWIEQFAPTAIRHEIEGQAVFEIQLPSLGPIPAFIWQSDETMIRSVGMKKEITPDTKMSDLRFTIYPNTSPNPQRDLSGSSSNKSGCTWSSTWNQIDRGLLSIALTKLDLTGLNTESDFGEAFGNRIEFAQAATEFIHHMQAKCLTTAVSIDVSERSFDTITFSNSAESGLKLMNSGTRTPTLGARISFVFPSQETAVEMAGAMQRMLEFSKSQLADHMKQIEVKPDKNVAEIERGRALERALTVMTQSIEKNGDGTAKINFATVIPFQTMIDFLINLEADATKKQSTQH